MDRNKLIEDHMWVVPIACRKHLRNCKAADREETYAEARLILVQAAQRFVDTGKVKFSTFAYHTIENSLYRPKKLAKEARILYEHQLWELNDEGDTVLSVAASEPQEDTIEVKQTTSQATNKFKRFEWDMRQKFGQEKGNLFLRVLKGESQHKLAAERGVTRQALNYTIVAMARALGKTKYRPIAKLAFRKKSTPC